MYSITIWVIKNTVIFFSLMFGDHHEAFVAVTPILWRSIKITIESFADRWWGGLEPLLSWCHLSSNLRLGQTMREIGELSLLTGSTKFVGFLCQFVGATSCDTFLKCFEKHKLHRFLMVIWLHQNIVRSLLFFVYINRNYLKFFKIS